MKVSEIKLIQKYLTDSDYYMDNINGKLDIHTNRAIHTALAERTLELPHDWSSWSHKRKSIAYLQLISRDNNIEAGNIDGFYGPQTENASYLLQILTTTGTLPRSFTDIVTIRANPHNYPHERTQAFTDYYGEPCSAALVRIQCPWTLRLDWDLNTTTNTISIHEKLSDSLTLILNDAFEIYGLDGIKNYGLDRYGGSFNCRKKRGSRTSWSTHAWGISIDWFPSMNKLKWDSDKAALAHPDLDNWWELWEKEGWVSLGRSENRDWMHVQAAKR